jgi:hypothetical protein
MISVGMLNQEKALPFSVYGMTVPVMTHGLNLLDDYVGLRTPFPNRNISGRTCDIPSDSVAPAPLPLLRFNLTVQ